MRVSNNRLFSINFETICVILLILGVSLGTLCSLSDVNFGIFDSVYFIKNSDNGFLSGSVFLRYFLFYSISLACVFLFGMTAVFQPFIILECVFTGVSFGYAVSGIYQSGIHNSLLFSVFTLIIPAVITVFSMIIAWREAFGLSVNIAKALFSARNFIGFKDAVKIYSVKFFVLEAIIAVSALIRCIFYSFF